MKTNQKGFSLIELMIVVAIIGILAAIALPAYQDYLVRAKLAAVQSTLDPLKMALSMYYHENGSFPNGTAVTTTAFVTPSFWSSIGLTALPTLPAEVASLAVDGTAQTSVKLTLTIGAGKIRASTIDGLSIDIIGAGGGSAITWQAGDGAGHCAATSPVTEGTAKKFFDCR